MPEFVCDCCNQPNPKWLYHTEHFRSPLVPNSKYVIAGWAACDECHALIEARDLEGISRRASVGQTDSYERGNYDRRYRLSLKLYRALFSHIQGHSEPFTEAKSAAIAAEDIGPV
jgi:hypothetical protein